MEVFPVCGFESIYRAPGAILKCGGRCFSFITDSMILDSSVVEHSAVNRRVVGSNPTRGAERKPANLIVCRFFCFSGIL